MLLASVLWGTTGVVAHQAPEGSDQLLVGLSTFGFGGLLLLVLDPRPTTRLLRDARRLPLALLGAVGVSLYASLYYVAMDRVGVAIGNVLALGSGPIFAVLLELVVDRRRIDPRWAAAAAVTVVGVALLAGSAGSAPGGRPVSGVLLALGAGFGYALYSWSGARLISRGASSRSAMGGIFVLASVGLLPAFLVLGPGPLTEPRGIVVLAYLALVPMALAYLLFGYGLRRLTASTATTLTLAEPVVATLLALVLLDERLSGLGWLGLAVIVVGLLMVALDERRTPGDRAE